MTPDDSSGSNHHWGRRSAIAVGIIVVLVLVFVALLPTLLSTGPGRRLLTGVVSDSIPGAVRAQAIELGWFGGQAFTGVELLDRDNRLVLAAPSIEAPELSLVGVMTGSGDYGPVRVRIAQADVRQEADGFTNLQKALSTDEALRQPSEQPTQMPEDFQIDLRLTVDELTYTAPDAEPVTMTDIDAHVQARSRNNVDVTLDGQVQGGETARPGVIQAQFTLRDAFGDDGQLDPAQLRFHGQANIDRFPVGLAGALAGMKGQLVRYLGQTLSVEAQTQPREDGAVAFTAMIQSPLLESPVAGSFGPDNLITLHTPEPLTYQLTPEVVASLTQPVEPDNPASSDNPGAPPAIVLAKTTPITLNLDQLVLRLRDATSDTATLPDRIDPQHSTLVGTIGFAPATLRRSVVAPDGSVAWQQFDLGPGQLEVQGQHLAELVRFLLEIEFATPGGEAVTDPPQSGQIISEPEPTKPSGPGRLTSTTDVTHLWTESGTFAPAAATLASHVTLDAIPSTLIDALAEQGGKLVAMLGPTTSAVADLRYQADQGARIDVELDSANTSGAFTARLTPDGTLELVERDAVLAIHVTPAVSQAMLQAINPMLAGVGAANVPMKLTVAHESFHMPLADFDWRQVQANASLETGQLTLIPGGFTGRVLDLMQTLNVLPSREQYPAELSPLELDINRGRLAYDDLLLSIAGAQLAFAGNVDLATRQLDLRMTLGRGFIEELRGLTVPIGGTISRPTIQSDALVQAALRTGLGELMEEVGGGEAGTILDILGGGGESPDKPGTPADGADRADPLRRLLDLGSQILQAQPPAPQQRDESRR